MSRLMEMEAFATVVEEGGYTNASRKLGISKSAISRHVTALENRLGARLISRTTRCIGPTEIGMAYLDRANRILNDAGEADALVAALHARPTGVLNISSATDFGLHIVSPHLPGFLSGFPEISVNLELGDARADLIADGFDMALRVGELNDSTMMARKIASYRTYLVASPGYLERNGFPAGIEGLQSHRLLFRSNRPGRNQWRLRLPDGHIHSIRSDGGLAVNSGQSLLGAAIAGQGIARLPEYLVADALQSGLVLDAMPDLPEQRQCVHAVHPNGRYVAPKVRAFIDYLLETIARK